MFSMPRNPFAPTAPWKHLELRAELLRKTRAFFDERGYLEVETPLLSHDTVVDRHLDPLAVTLFRDARDPGEGERLWLQTSPEFGMKRLLAAGAPSIYQIAKAFRGGEQGAVHNPEFTMLEWYGVGDDYFSGMEFLSQLAEALLRRGPAERITYRQAFISHAGIDPFAASLEELHAVTTRLVPGNHDADDRDLLLDLLLTRVVEPYLGQTQPVILHDYPSWQAALAKVREDDAGDVAERFELYVDGMELANGYHELQDPLILTQRNQVNNQHRLADGKPALPEESQLLAAMQHGLPQCTGCALGFDRLVMVAAGVRSLREVLAFPIDRA